MIETINPTYKVSSLKYGFKVETQDKEKAKKIDENLSKTIRFIEALSKYHTFSRETSCMDGAEQTSYYPHYVIDEDGKLTGIDIKYNVVKDNSYYGRRPSCDRGTSEKYSMDIVSVIDCYSNIQICIVKSIDKNKLEYYVSSSHIVEDWLNTDGKTVCLSLESEKQQLFEALAKEGKRWNAETKQIEDLPKEYEFKPKDWCLMCNVDEINGKKVVTTEWTLCQFSHYLGDYKIVAVGGDRFSECIPYNEKTAHLLGTTDDWKGGEG